MTAARRVVLDTNTILSALLFEHGRLVPLRSAWQAGTLTPLLCTPTVEELLRVLACPKFRLAPAEREELLADFLPYGEVVPPWQARPGLPACRDGHDQVFLELAAVGAAEWLVIGDSDLLRLAGHVPFRIIEPVLAIALLTSTGGPPGQGSGTG